MCPLTNPCTRTPAAVQLEKFCCDVQSGSWGEATKRLCRGLAKPPCSIDKLMQALRRPNYKERTDLSLYPGTPTDYQSVHFVRALVAAARSAFSDFPEDWATLEKMGAGASDGAVQFKVTEFSVALELSKQIGELLQKPYSLADFTCYICLLHGRLHEITA